MKRLLSFIIVLLATIIASERVKAQSDNAMFYEISGDGITGPVYLMGTMHVVCEFPDSFQKKLSKAVEEVDKVVLELDLDDPDMQTKMVQLSTNAGMKNVFTDLDENSKSQLDTWFTENFGAGISQVGVYKPFMLYSMVVSKLIACQQSAEMEIIRLASENEREVEGLETIEFQVGMFESIPLEDKISWLLELVENEETYATDMKRMMEAYTGENLQTLFEISTAYPEFEKYNELILTSRNESWIDPILQYAEEGPVLIAVGAAHLPEEKGVIQLLRQRGYKVTPAFTKITP